MDKSSAFWGRRVCFKLFGGSPFQKGTLRAGLVPFAYPAKSSFRHPKPSVYNTTFRGALRLFVGFCRP